MRATVGQIRFGDGRVLQAVQEVDHDHEEHGRDVPEAVNRTSTRTEATGKNDMHAAEVQVSEVQGQG